MYFNKEIIRTVKQKYLLFFPFLFFCITSPWPIVFRYALILFLIAALFLILVDRKTIFQAVKPKIFLISLYFLTLCLSLLWTDNIKSGLKVIERSLSFIVFPVLFLPIIEEGDLKKALKKILVVFACGVVFSILYGYVYEFIYELYFPKNKWTEYITKNSVNYFFHNVVLKLDFHHSYLSLYCLVASIIFLFLKYEKNKWIYIVTGFFLLLQPLLFRSRIATVLALLILLIWCFKKGKKLVVGIAILLLVVATYFNNKLFDRFSNVLESSYNSERNIIWKSSLDLIKNNYILGIGAGDVEDDLVKKYKEYHFDKGVKIKYNTHNQYLQTYLISGLFGIIVLLYLLFSIFIPIKQRREELNIIFNSIFTLIIISFLTESMLQRERGVFMFCMMYTMAMINSLEKRRLDE
ncbi:O-antigen ligase [Algibacter lectus]|uniref:O-antigen ligase family protein n=1 Tax=Algibacter lectus TaxID=221126 RepID=UPI0008DF7D4B|nr:O-antigen ligase family protein [Algibacter lectus]SFC64097.1 O-antigen ligase [Algibacter lectus]